MALLTSIMIIIYLRNYHIEKTTYRSQWVSYQENPVININKKGQLISNEVAIVNTQINIGL